MYQALYRKWRPLVFEDVIGQSHVTDTLKSQLENNRLSHAYLFTGTRGTGKTTCAKILARAVNCQNLKFGDPCNECPSCTGILNGSILDVLEIDAASNNGVENIREIRDEVSYLPAEVKKRVYIIDEVHMLSTGAFNALLKTLEEPPEHAVFILATTEVHKVPATILSRCQRFDFKRISPSAIAARLKKIALSEQLDLTDGGASLIARLADGSMRDALSILDRLALSAKQTLDEDYISQSMGLLGYENSVALLKKIEQKDIGGCLSLFSSFYADGRDPAAIIDQLLTLYRDLLVIKISSKTAPSVLVSGYDVSYLSSLASGFSSDRLTAGAFILQDALASLSKTSSKRLETEICLIKLCSAPASGDLSGLLSRIDTLEEKLNSLAQGGDLKRIAKTESSAPPSPIEQAHPSASAALKTPAKSPASLSQSSTPVKSKNQEENSNIRADLSWESLVQSLRNKVGRSVFAHLNLLQATFEGHTIRIVADAESLPYIHTDEVKTAIQDGAKALFGGDFQVVFVKDDSNQASSLMDLISSAKDAGVKLNLK